MESLPPEMLSPVTTAQRTSIPLRSILNVDDGHDSAEKLQPRTPPPEAKAVVAEKTAVQRSQFLFVNTHNPSSRNPRLRQDQKVINAHVQHASHRQRQAAAAAAAGGLKRIVRLCSQCAGSTSRSRVIAPKRSTSPSSSTSHSLPAIASVSDGPPQRPLQRSSLNAPVCAQCGTSLQSTEASRKHHNSSKMTLKGISSIASAVASSEANASQLTLFMADQPTSFLDSGMLDPFATSAVSLNMEMNGVILHFLHVIVGGMYPVRSQAEAQTEFSVQICLAEPAALFAVLAVSAADLQARTGHLSNESIHSTPTEGQLSRRKVPAFMDYKFKAIKAVNEKMASAAKAAEAAIIVVVMSFTMLESITGNQDELSRHVAELQKLLMLRGGYHGLPTGVVSAAVPICYMSATITRSFPIFPPPSPLAAASASTYDRITSSTDPQLKQIGTGLLDPDVAGLFDESLVKAFCDLREVTLYREFFHNQECHLPEIEVEYFSVKAYETLHRVLSIPFQFPKMTSPQQEPCRLALLVFWHANWAIHLPDSGVFRSLTTQLKSALQQSNLHSLWHPYDTLLIWVMFLGAYISAGQKEHSWFMMYLARSARQRGLKCSKELKAVLRRFFYIDRIYRKGLGDIWNEASILMDAL